jgi:hypothetical protein
MTAAREAHEFDLGYDSRGPRILLGPVSTSLGTGGLCSMFYDLDDGMGRIVAEKLLRIAACAPFSL